VDDSKLRLQLGDRGGLEPTDKKSLQGVRGGKYFLERNDVWSLNLGTERDLGCGNLQSKCGVPFLELS